MRKGIRVTVQCAVCEKALELVPSRAKQNKSNVCSESCRREKIRQSKIELHQSAERRIATCATCGTVFERKPSQLAKYASNYCSRTCKAAAMAGAPQPHLVNGAEFPCENCGQPVWRTPATLRNHVFCSRRCAVVLHSRRRGPRVQRICRPCPTCGVTVRMLPGHASRPGRRFCSHRCAAIEIQGAKRGLPGNAWTQAQRDQVARTLRRKYATDWRWKPLAHSIRMTGSGNPAWRGGTAHIGYTPGFTPTLKRQIAARDGNRCQICGVRRGHGTHVVHHIDGRKDDHRPRNLVLLCHRCHGKLHHGRAALPARFSAAVTR